MDKKILNTAALFESENNVLPMDLVFAIQKKPINWTYKIFYGFKLKVINLYQE
jgi:hypothetical protein